MSIAFSALLAHSTSAWLPLSERSWRDQVLMLHHQRHGRRLAALRPLIEACGKKGIACVSLKGPLLAERFYEKPFLRPSNDLDLMIHESDVAASVRLMQKLGFELQRPLPWNLQRRIGHHFELRTDGIFALRRSSLQAACRRLEAYLDSAEFMERSVIWRSPSGFELPAAGYVCGRRGFLLPVSTPPRTMPFIVCDGSMTPSPLRET